ncbi:MAG: glycosyltransferase family protein [Candidatus Staskawiczbacteria bacterium]|nr:glycosyltransferase family protein [Candidatus Staskawiczbacteria bacterium]MBI3337251.1 glycosyltransferase family protein [Candidatus Staskawiczbacteria bacterium]
MKSHKSHGKIIAIIQARTSSTRLPGKVLLDLLGQPVLIRVVERVLKSKIINEIIVATTNKREDDVIAKLIQDYNNQKVTVFRGSEQNVLDRYFKAANYFNANIIVRITSDCPLIDPKVIDKVIDSFLTSDSDYVSNILDERTYPRGLDVEVFSFDTLKKVFELAKNQDDKEHVTLYIRKNSPLFKTKNIKNNKDYSFYRWTLDEKEDYELLKILYNNVYPKNPNFTMKDVILFFEKNPEIIKVNENIKQKNT